MRKCIMRERVVREGIARWFQRVGPGTVLHREHLFFERLFLLDHILFLACGICYYKGSYQCNKNMKSVHTK